MLHADITHVRRCAHLGNTEVPPQIASVSTFRDVRGRCRRTRRRRRRGSVPRRPPRPHRSAFVRGHRPDPAHHRRPRRRGVGPQPARPDPAALRQPPGGHPRRHTPLRGAGHPTGRRRGCPRLIHPPPCARNPTRPEMKLALAGDTMLGRGVAERLAVMPRLGQVVAAQPVGDLGRIALVVLHPASAPVQPRRVHQMHLGAGRLQQVGRPLPGVGRLQCDFGTRTGLRQSPNPSATGSLSILTVWSFSPASSIRTITDRRRCRSIPTYCRSTGPPLLEVLVERPRVLTRSDDPEAGRTFFLMPAPVIAPLRCHHRPAGGRTPPRHPLIASPLAPAGDHLGAPNDLGLRGSTHHRP